MSWRATVAAAIVIAAACFLIVRGNGYQNFIIVTVGLTAIVGIGLNVLVGLSGQISLGHVAFYAIGAYAVGILTTALSLAVLAGARRRRHRLRTGRRVPRHTCAARAWPLSGNGDHRVRLRRRARGGGVAGFDRRLERAVRHSQSDHFRRGDRREGHRIPHRGADCAVGSRVCAAQRQRLGQRDAGGEGRGNRKRIDRARPDLDPHHGFWHFGCGHRDCRRCLRLDQQFHQS